MQSMTGFVASAELGIGTRVSASARVINECLGRHRYRNWDRSSVPASMAGVRVDTRQ